MQIDLACGEIRGSRLFESIDRRWQLSEQERQHGDQESDHKRTKRNGSEGGLLSENLRPLTHWHPIQDSCCQPEEDGKDREDGDAQNAE